MFFGRALEAVDGEVEQNLDEVGAVDAHIDVLGKRFDEERVVLDGGMDAEQFVQVGEDVIDADGRVLLGILAQETEVTAGNLDAIRDLAGDGA